MLWFKFHNHSTGNDVYINLEQHVVSIGPKSAEIFPIVSASSNFYGVHGEDRERLMRLMEHSQHPKGANP